MGAEQSPICKPVVNTRFNRMNGLQRAAECFRYVVLCAEWWISPEGTIRQWLRYNARVGVLLFIPALLVMPVVGLILWQIAAWLSMLNGIVGRLILLPVLVLALLIVLRVVTALCKR